jgi:hypothetical protein
MEKSGKKGFRRQLFLLWLLGATVSTFAQRPFHFLYVFDKHLPSPEATSVSFTSSGEGWVCYSSGEYISRFDGVNWVHYQMTALGLPAGLNFYGENGQGVWFQVFKNNMLTVVRFTKNQMWESYNLSATSTYFNRENGALVSLGTDLYEYTFDAEEKKFVRSEEPLLSLSDPKELVMSLVNEISDGEAYVLTDMSVTGSRRYHYGKGFAQFFETDDVTFAPLSVSEKGIKGVYQKEGKYYWFSEGTYTPLRIRLPNGREARIIQKASLRTNAEERFPRKHLSGFIAEDPVDNVSYLYRLDSLGNAHLVLSHLLGVLKSFSQDRQGNWWYASSNGLVRTDQALLTFDEADPDMVKGLHTIGEDEEGNIWFGGYNDRGWFAVYDGTRLQRRYFKDGALPILPGTYRNASGVQYFFAEGLPGLYTLKDNKFTGLKIFHTDSKPLTGYFFHPLSNGKIGLGLTTRGLGIADEISGLISHIKLIGKDKGMLLDNVLTITEDRGGRLWLGRTSQGIALYDPGRDTAVTWLRSPEVPGSVGALSSCLGDDGRLWLGAHNGLYYLTQPERFDYKNDTLFSHLKKLHLPGGDESAVSLLKNIPDFLVIGSNRAIYFLDKKYRGERPRIYTLQYGEDIAGLGSEQNSVLHDSKGFLWIGSQTCATQINLRQLSFDTSATGIRLSYFRAGDTEVPIDDNRIGKLPGKKRNLKITFSPSGNPFLRDDLFYDIFIIGEKGDTLFRQREVRQREIELAYVPYGDYTLRVVAYKHNVLSGAANFSFRVPQLLTESHWFWLGLATLILVIPFSWILYRNKQQKLVLKHQVELEQSNREKDSLKIQALSNFFNPHFINNALHWVQSRYRKDPETALVVGRLSDNVEHLYANTQSGKAFHSLRKELEIVGNYLKIQEVRFGIELNKGICLPANQSFLDEVQVPSMLLQIHSENAVEKGIRNRKQASHFALHVENTASGIRITIEDDGRGRPPDAVDEPASRKGSTAVMNDLVRLFNSYNREPIDVRYDDHIFQDEHAVTYGTRVSIFIPKNYHYELS